MNKAVVKLLWFSSLILALWPHHLLAEDLVILRGNEDYPPDEMHVDGKLTGFHIELIENAAKLIPLTVKFESIPWKRAIQMLNDGDGDALTYISKNPEREKHAIFLDANILTESHYHFIINNRRKSDILDNGKLKPLSQYTIGVQRGYDYSKEFQFLTFKNKIIFNSVKQMLALLNANRIDIAILTMAEYTAQKESIYFKYVDIIQPAFTSNASYLAFSIKSKNRNAPQLFAKAMTRYKASEAFQILKDKYNK